MKVVFIVGPTASGKSALALHLAQQFQGAIVNCDSIQVYRGCDIGSAKPAAADFEKVPHFLYNIMDFPQEMTAGEYSRLFFETAAQLEKKVPVIFVVGGTGFYFQAIEKGMYQIGAANHEMKQELETIIESLGGAELLHSELKTRDAESAARISVNDHYRLVRAIELIRTHGKTVSEIQKEFADSRKPFPYPLLKLGIRTEKQEFKDKVEARTQAMLHKGLIGEVQQLLQRVPQTWAPMESVGYKEVVQFLKAGDLSEQELGQLIVQNTMKLIKKQLTWFKRDPEIHWLGLHDQATPRTLVEKFVET